MTIKESYAIEGQKTTWGNEAFKENTAKSDGLAVRRFREAGAHFMGKTNVPLDLADFQSFNSIYGTTNNPWNLERIPGGSSGGSAAALAAEARTTATSAPLVIGTSTVGANGTAAAS